METDLRYQLLTLLDSNYLKHVPKQVHLSFSPCSCGYQAAFHILLSLLFYIQFGSVMHGQRHFLSTALTLHYSRAVQSITEQYSRYSTVQCTAV